MTDRLRRMFDSEQFRFDELFKMFIPLILDQLFIFAIGILSTAMVASSGTGAMAAMGLVTVLNSLAYALFSGFAIGGGILIARAKGAGDAELVRRALGQCTGICLLIGLILGVLMSTCGEGLVRLFYPKVGDDITEAAAGFLRYMGLSLIPYSMYCAVFNAFRSLGETRSSLYLTIMLNSLHLVFSLIYINGLGMGVTGSGLSFLTCRIIGIVFAMWWLMRKGCPIGMKFRHYLSRDAGIYREIIKLGMPLAMEQLMFQGGMLLVGMYVALLPVNQMDAQGIVNSVFNLFYITAYSIMNLTATVCGQCVGAGSIKLTRFYLNSFLKAGRVLMLLTVVIIWPLMPLVLRLYSPAADVYPYVYKAMLAGSCALPLLWCDAYVIPSATRAAGDTLFTTWLSISALFAGRMALGYVLTITLKLGIPGVWLGQCAEWLIRALVLRLRVRGNRWIKTEVKEID